MSLEDSIHKQVKNHMGPKAHYGFAALERPMSFHIYKQWLQKGHHGSMNYLVDHADMKEKPQRLLPRAQSALVVTKNYLPHPAPFPSSDKKALSLRTALYAKGQDYHHFFKNQLHQLSQSLKLEFPQEEFLSFTDSAPVLERDLAYRAGLGWFGKNTCLIHSQKGSLFFIGEIYTSLKINAFAPLHPDRCGNCTRCIDACPTQALSHSHHRELDARKCISYLNIESRSLAPHPLHGKMNDWFFGCDICQAVCPWNEKVFGRVIKEEQILKKKVTNSLIEDLRWILSSSNKSLERTLQNSPLSRAKGLGLKRNAIVLIANLKIQTLKEDVSNYAQHKRLKGVAQWCLNSL